MCDAGRGKGCTFWKKYLVVSLLTDIAIGNMVQDIGVDFFFFKTICTKQMCFRMSVHHDLYAGISLQITT